MIHRLSLGPIVGAVGPNWVNIWGRAEPGIEPRQLAVRVRAIGSVSWSDPQLAPINPAYDFTAVVRFNQALAAAGEYEFQAGWFIDSELDATSEPSRGINWPQEMGISGQFWTAPDDKTSSFHFITGSCRNLGEPLNLWGLLPWKGPCRWAERAFETLLAWLDADDPPRLAVMTGDQVYADKRNAGLMPPPPKSFEDYAARYRKAYGTPCYSQSLARLPVYMMMDDHEIENNWGWSDYYGKRNNSETKKFNIQTFKNGIRAYEAYQVSHSPLIPGKPDKFDRRYNHYWYDFNYGCAAFFVMDVRGERQKNGGTTVVNDPNRANAPWEYRASEPRMINEKQEEGLLNWLKQQDKDRVKFVVSPVPLFPDSSGVWPLKWIKKYSGEPGDKWAGFPFQRQKILNFIRDHDFQRVVFLSGDVHCSYVARLDFEGWDVEKPNSIHTIVSSGFNWPVPGLNANHFPHRRLPFIEKNKKSGARRPVPGRYFITMLTREGSWPGGQGFHTRNNLTRIAVDGNGLKVEIFSSHGQPLEQVRIAFP